MVTELDPQLLEILACPGDRGPLRTGAAAGAAADALTCTTCGAVFPVRDGIPVLLWDEAQLPPATAGSGGGRE